MDALATADRPREGAARGALGRAERFARADGAPGEVWALGAADEALAARLAALGAAGIGGFAGAGKDARGAWVVRRAASRTVHELARGERVPWRRALAITAALARALDACERAALTPGALGPRDIALGAEGDDGGADTAWIVAEPLVRALVGAPPDARGASARGAAWGPWAPPEHADGAPWSAAANRYVVGLVAYRLIAGAHPFGGAGARHAMRAQADGAPPFDDALARELEPGVQGFVLWMLEPAPRARPASAAEIARACDALLAPPAARIARAGPLAPAVAPRAAPTSPRAAPPREAASPRAAPTRARGLPRVSPRALPARARPIAPIAAGLAVAVALGALARASAGPTAAPAPRARPAAPIAATTSADCASCHAREVGEWRRSVMAHAARSPLFGALESLVEEQVGRDDQCPNGAGVLRRAGPASCRDEQTGLLRTGAGGEHWCVSCHAPGENLAAAPGDVPPWSALGDPRARAPLVDVLPASALEGISCASCHETAGPVGPHGPAARGGRYEGNPTWTSPLTGQSFRARPEDGEGLFGIANSGYALDPSIFLGSGDFAAHRRPPRATRDYLASSAFCGACHDVRLFGTDVVGVAARGEHFKRLRNGYTEWRAWADAEARAGRTPATCQGCHMSTYPGVCVPAGGARDADDGCPSGARFEPRAAGDVARGAAQHYFTSVEIPLAPAFDDALASERLLDAAGLPTGLRARRDLLLRHTFRLAIDAPRRDGARLEIPIVLENVGAGHRAPGGFSQEREAWVELTVRDARGALVYQVGALARDDADLADKVFLRVTTGDDARDARGRPLGLFGADVVDGPDAPRWSPSPARGGTRFRGRGLVNLQNGFARCVRCIGVIDARGACQPGPGQGRTRADRYEDGAYDLDTGECGSNLSGDNALFETYFPVGALDADRGIFKAPDAILDTRSAPPDVPLTYVYELDAGAHPPPFEVDARLRFRAFPPYLLRAFAAYEARQAARGLRPSGPQITEGAVLRVDVTDIARAHARIP